MSCLVFMQLSMRTLVFRFPVALRLRAAALVHGQAGYNYLPPMILTGLIFAFGVRLRLRPVISQSHLVQVPEGIISRVGCRSGAVRLELVRPALTITVQGLVRLLFLSLPSKLILRWLISMVTGMRLLARLLSRPARVRRFKMFQIKQPLGLIAATVRILTTRVPLVQKRWGCHLHRHSVMSMEL